MDQYNACLVFTSQVSDKCFHFLAALENAAHNVDFEQFTPVHNASTRSAEVSSHVMEACVNDVAESTSNVSSPKGPTRGGSSTLLNQPFFLMTMTDAYCIY